MTRRSDCSNSPRGPSSSASGDPRRLSPGNGSARSAAKKRTTLSLILEVVFIVAAAFVIAMVVQSFVVKPFTIHQVSMQPTLLEGDRVLINRLAYHFRDPERGDVIVFQSPVDPREDLVKRIVAVGGDTVAVRAGVLYVNGEAVAEPYLAESPFAGPDMPAVTLRPTEVFVMGDNRNNSGDSRLFGPVGVDAIIGCAFAIYWPIGRWGGV